MTVEQIKFELEDALKHLDEELEKCAQENFCVPIYETDEQLKVVRSLGYGSRNHPDIRALYANHVRKTFITGIRSLVDHI